MAYCEDCLLFRHDEVRPPPCADVLLRVDPVRAGLLGLDVLVHRGLRHGALPGYGGGRARRRLGGPAVSYPGSRGGGTTMAR